MHAIGYRFSGQNVKHLQESRDRQDLPFPVRPTAWSPWPIPHPELSVSLRSAVRPAREGVCDAWPLLQSTVPARHSRFLLWGCPLLSQADGISRDVGLAHPWCPLQHSTAQCADCSCIAAPEGCRASLPAGRPEIKQPHNEPGTNLSVLQSLPRMSTGDGFSALTPGAAGQHRQQ